MLLKDLQYKRRNNIIEFELRNASAANRLKSLGRDRFCNRYWFFDANHGSIPMQAITNIDQDETLESKPDPDIPYNYSAGILFIEVFGFQQNPVIRDPGSDCRLGQIDGKWGYNQSRRTMGAMEVLGVRKSRWRVMYTRTRKVQPLLYVSPGLCLRTDTNRKHATLLYAH